jgi:large subunit ribosomal protein L15
MPLYRRTPKRGFTPLHRNRYRIVNLREIAGLDETEITPQVLRDRGLIGVGSDPVKVLAHGELDQAVTVRAHAFSASARSKIEAAGGHAELID